MIQNFKQNDSTIKFSTEILKPFICDYSDAYILVTGYITVAGGDNNTRAAFKNCHPFTRSVVHLNHEHVNTCENLDIIMNMYNLIEYSNNYADSAASLYEFKRHEQPKTNAGLDDVTTNNSYPFKYKSSLLGDSENVDARDDTNNPLAHRLCKM